MTQVSDEIIRRAEAWLCDAVDEQTQQEVRRMLESDHAALEESFFGDLEFGTGGLRGIMGVGTMRMNRYTVGMATQGLANYVIRQKPGVRSSVVIAHDSRNQSAFFAKTAADVLSANGIQVFLFPELRPTPLLSFAVRYLGCTAGIVVTASHNPKEYNGYKVYWEDGAQVLPPHDRGIIAEVRAVEGLGAVRFAGNSALIASPGADLEEAYLSNLDGLIHVHEAIRAAHDMPIVFTPIHGTGITLVPRALEKAGFRAVHIVQEQAVPDGNFPTVISPNPEEKEALSMALGLAERVGADLLMGNDPDADRVGIAIRNPKGELTLLNGNQAGSLLVWYELMQYQRAGRLDGHQFVASTIVTSELFPAIAAHFGVPCHKTLTGFKYIAELMRREEGKSRFVAGGEESYGYLAGDFVRDKDAVISSVKFAEIAAWCKSAGRSVWDLLMEIYGQCGLFHDELVSITLRGIEGMKKIDDMMNTLRQSPPGTLGGSRVTEIRDLKSGESVNCTTGGRSAIDLPASNVLQFVLEDGSQVSVRPSGTEPKIKFYFSFRAPFEGPDHYEEQIVALRERAAAVRRELGV
jgi:phosphoglucomutase